MNQIERFKKMQEDAKKGKAKGFQSSLDDLRQNTQFYGKAKAPVKAPIKSVSPSYVPEDGDIFSSAGMGYAPAVERPTYKGNAWLDSNIFFGSKREKASKMHELDNITQARLSNDFASDPMRFAGQRTRDVVRNYAPNPYAAVEFTDAGEDLVNNSKFGKNVINPILSGYYDTMRSKSAGRELLYGSDSTEAVSEYGKLADKYRPEQSSGLVDRTLKGLGSFGGQMMANYGTPEMALGLMAGGVGGKVAAAKGSLELGTGALYLDMVEQGVDKETAKAIAMGGGMINAGLEMAQLDEIIKGLKVARGNPIATGAIIGGIQRAGLTEAVERALGSKVGSFVTKTALPVAANWAKGVAKETGQELMQEAVSIGAENLGKYQSGIELDSWSDVGRRLKDTAIDSALTFGVMGVPGAIGGAYHNNITPYSPKTQNKANLGGIVDDGAIHQEAVQSPSVVQPALPNGAEKQASYNPVRDGGPIEEVRAFQNENAQRMAQIGKRLGARVEFFEGDPIVNGHYKDGKISINVNSERSAEYVFGHELYHFLRDQDHNQELDKLTNFLLGEAKDLLLPGGDLNSLIQAKVEQYNSYGEKLEGYQAKEELLADAVGKLLESEGAIERLVRYDQGMFQKVRYWVEDMIARFRGTPEERRFLQAHKLLERAVEKSTGIVSGESSGAYSYVGTDSNGIRHYESDMKGYTNKEAVEYFSALAQKYMDNDDIRLDFDGKTLTVDVHQNFARETLNQNRSNKIDVVAKMLPDLADIIQNSTWDDARHENQNRKGSKARQKRHKHFVFWDYFKTTVFMDGKPYDVQINIVEDKKGNNSIYQVLAKNNKTGVTAGILNNQVPLNSVTPVLDTNTLPQQNQSVNTQNQKFSLGDGQGAYLMNRGGGAHDTQPETSVRYDDSGNPYVMIEKNLFDGVELSQDNKTRFKQIKEIVKNYLQNEIGNAYRIYESGQLVNIDGKFQKEFTGSTHSHSMNLRNPHVYEKKMNAATELGDLIGITTGRQWQKSNKQGQLDRYYGVYHYNTKFGIPTPNGVENYDAVLVIRNDANGKKYLYDIQGIKKSNSLHTSLTNNVSMSHQNGVVLDTNSIAGQPQNVNPYLSDDPTDGMKSLGGELVMPGGMMENVPEGEFKTRSFYQSASGSGRVHPEVRQNLLQNIANEATQAMYRVQSNDETKAMVRQRINDMGVDQLEAAIDYKIANNEKMKAEDMLSAIGLIEHYSKTGELERAQNMIADLSVIATELGQAVQVMRLMKALTPQGALMRIEKSLQKINADLKPHQKIVLSDDRRADILNSEMGSDDMRRAVIMAEAEINQKVPADWWAKWNAWRYLSMLGNPRTHIRNIVGNGLFVLPKTTKDVFGAVTESIVSRTIDPNMERTKTLRPVDRDLKLVADHLFRDYQENLTGHGKENTILDRRIFNTKALEGLRRFNSNMLEAEDAFFLGKHFKTSVAKYLKANHIKASDIANIVLDKDGRKTVQMRQPNDRTGQILADAIEYGILEAQKATFRDFNRLSNEINRLKKRGRGWQVGLDAVAPFTQTPLNIMRRGYEYSPLGAIEGIKKAIQSSKDGSVSTADIIDAFSASASGTATTFVLGMMLAKAGLVTGDEEDDEKALNDLEQNQNYALQIGGHSFTLDWAAPMSLPFFLGVETYNVTKGKDFFDSLGNLTDSATKLADPMVNMSMLQGLNRITKEFKYADSPSAALSNATVSALSGYVGQGVPTLGGQIARTIDGTRRTKYIDKNSGVPKVFQQFKNDVQSKIPGLESKLPAYIDPFGREEKTGSNWASRALQNMVLPGFYSKKPNDKVTQEIRKLYESSGDRAVIPKGAVRYVDGNYGKKFTPSEYEAYNKTKGTKTHELLKDVISAKGYQKLSEQEKIDQIKSAMEYAKELANNKHLGKPLGKKHQEMKDLEKKGMSFGEISGYEMAKKAFEEAKKGDKVKATKINPFADLKLKGKEREDYILSQMSDAAQRKWEHVKARGVADADTYYMTYMVVTSSAGGEKRKKEDKIKDLVAMGYGEDQAYAIFEVITSKKKKWN